MTTDQTIRLRVNTSLEQDLALPSFSPREGEKDLGVITELYRLQLDCFSLFSDDFSYQIGYARAYDCIPGYYRDWIIDGGQWKINLYLRLCEFLSWDFRHSDMNSDENNSLQDEHSDHQKIGDMAHKLSQFLSWEIFAVPLSSDWDLKYMSWDDVAYAKREIRKEVSRDMSNILCEDIYQSLLMNESAWDDKPSQLSHQLHKVICNVDVDRADFLPENKIVHDEHTNSGKESGLYPDLSAAESSQHPATTLDENNIRPTARQKKRAREKKKKIAQPEESSKHILPNRASPLKVVYDGKPAVLRLIAKENASDADLWVLKGSCCNHPNLLGSHYVEYEDSYHVTIEPFISSLEEFIKSLNHSAAGRMEGFMRAIVNAVLYLHKCEYIHGDLRRPSNIVICQGALEGSFTCKVMGMTGQSNIDGGSCGRDFEDLGHLIAYYLNNCQGSFGKTHEYEKFIEQNYPEAHDLIINVLLRKTSPPTDTEVSRHPFFYRPDEVVLLLTTTSEYLQNVEDPGFSSAIEDIGSDVFGNNWSVKLNEGSSKRYEVPEGHATHSMCSLLRYIRNQVCHPYGTEDKILCDNCENAKEFVNFCCTRIPKLVIKLFQVLRNHRKDIILDRIY